MTWVTWRQSRTELFIFAAALALVALFLIWTGLDLQSHYDSLGIANCLANDESSGTCERALMSFNDRLNGVLNLANWLIFFPLLAGVLVAAPLIVDFEQGTYRLAWTQSVTRTRWLATKIALGLAILTVMSLTLIVLWKWWRNPFVSSADQFGMNQWDTTFFSSRVVLISYTIFAFALCVSVGTLFRRSIAAFGISLIGFVGVRILIETKLREHFLAPLKSIGDPMNPPESGIGNGAWILSNAPSDQFGNLKSWSDPAVQACFPMKSDLGPIPVPADIDAAMSAQQRCFQDHDLYMTTLYHPADRYWIFQGIETAIFLGLSAILLGITFYLVSRRIAR